MGLGYDETGGEIELEGDSRSVPNERNALQDAGVETLLEHLVLDGGLGHAHIEHLKEPRKGGVVSACHNLSNESQKQGWPIGRDNP